MSEAVLLSNCFLFALRRWRQRGGYLIVRRSHYGWWPHFFWSADMRSIEQFEPIAPKKDGLRFPPLWFAGYVKVSRRTHKPSTQVF